VTAIKRYLHPILRHFQPTVRPQSLRLSSPIMPFIIRMMDMLTIWLSGLLALEVRAQTDLNLPIPWDLKGYYSLIAVGGLLFLLFSNEVYRSWRGAAVPFMLARVTGSWLMVVGLLLLWLFITKASEDYSRLWFGLWSALGASLLCCERLLAYSVLRHLRLRGFNLKHVALIGEGQAAEQLENRLHQAGWSGYQIAERLHQPEEAELEALSERGLDEIWLALPLSDAKEIHRILKGLRHTSASIRLSPDWLTFRLINHGVSDILGIPMLDLSTSPMEGLNRIVKLFEDRILSLVILILLSPLMVILAIGVKLSSKGPIFYQQERVGLNNRSFVMLKFRSMPIGADSDLPQWGGATQKVTTRFGRFIRKTSLDELPQFINVLKGDMSIVGPRPERPQFVEQFKDEIPDYMRKHLVKAGITGWAQINGWRGDTDLQARIEHDLYYIEHWSLLLDLKIIVLTLFRIFQDPNAR